MMKILLLLVTTIAVIGLIATKPNAPVRSAFRGVGLIGVPLSVFLMVEGFYHTRSRGRYFGRLVLFAALAEVPTMFLMIFERARNIVLRPDFKELTQEKQMEHLFEWQEFPSLDYLFTLVLCFLLVWIIDAIFRKFQAETESIVRKTLLGVAMVMTLIIVLFASGLGQMLKWFGYPIIALMLAFFCVIFRGKRDMLTVVFAIVGLTYGAFLAPEGEKLMFALGLSLPAILVRLYDGTLGYNKEQKPWIRVAFYSFYVSMLAMTTFIAMAVFAAAHRV